MKANRRLKIISAVMMGILILVIAVKSYIFPNFQLPNPKGPYKVGQIDLEMIDDTRQELYTSDQSDRRKIMVSLWYPMESSLGDPEPYPEEVTAALNKVIGLPKVLFSHFSKTMTHVYKDGEPANLTKESPLILYSPGNNSTRFQNMAVIERLVSEGYSVLGVDHPYTSNDLQFTDGSIAYRNLSLDETGVDLFEKEVDIRIQDMSFALEQLKENTDLIDMKIWNNIDFDTIGVFGHSYGGATIAGLMAENTDILAGLSYDGGLWGKVVDTGFEKPFLYLSASETLDYLKGEDKERSVFVRTVLDNLKVAYSNSRDEVGYALIEGFNHYSFTDLTLFSPLLSKGTSPLDTTVDITLNYFDYWLKGKRTLKSMADIFEKYDTIHYSQDEDLIIP